ncbi:MAG TPA: AsmA family protein [Limnobacter sp.]|nr:AsmA family protein [Limnobacter sp.]
MDRAPITAKLQKKSRLMLGLGATFAALLSGVLVCELLAWPFLAKPAERILSDALQRRVELTSPAGENADFRLRFLGGIRLNLKHLEIAAPGWSDSPYMIQASNLALRVRYIDLLRWRGQADEILRIDSLQADRLDGHLERLADGRASWQFNRDKPDEQAGKLPEFGLLAVKNGVLSYRDEPLDLNLVSTLALQEGNVSGDALLVEAKGRYQGQPLDVKLNSSGVLPWIAEKVEPIPVELNATLGGAKLAFKGKSSDALKLQKMSGHFVLSGSSLGAAGKALGVTLPETPPFRTEGDLTRDVQKWTVSVQSAKVGSSNLKGDFVFEANASKKLLTGVLQGESLVLSDLAPSVGADNDKPGDRKSAKTGRVLPDREFDLPSLRAMDASVRIDIQNLDLGSEVLKPLRPLRAHVGLSSGVLSISDIDASTAQGHVEGAFELDATGEAAAWKADLAWDSIELEQWIKLPREGNRPPYITGRMNGQAKLQGQGRSTAEILGSLNGTARTQIRNGRISHLVIEAAGLDAAETLGVWFKGDEVLNMNCAVADLKVKDGVVEPAVFVIDTQDSALWLNGRLSMKTEALDLKLVVTPKDFSPVSLRAPILITGTLAKPDVSIEKGPLAGRLAGAAVLSLINPFAALLPFIDTGSKEAKEHVNRSGCHNLAERAKAQRAKAGR